MEGPGTQTPAGLLRVSIGLEDVSDLQADLAAALQG
jgi:cystathionine beta-lyase/cystathionine gamma-synthase